MRPHSSGTEGVAGPRSWPGSGRAATSSGSVVGGGGNQLAVGEWGGLGGGDSGGEGGADGGGEGGADAGGED
eukprot:1065314-Pleurochrysis_carterae.AAC.1